MGVFTGRSPPSSRRWIAAAALLVTVCVLGAGVAVALSGGDDDDVAARRPSSASTPRDPQAPAGTDEAPPSTPGGSEGTPATPPPTSASSPSTPASTSSTEGTGATSDGALAQRPVPPGVRQQFEAVQIGDGPCAEYDPEDAPLVATGRPTEFVLTDVLICLPGFDPASTTDIEITAPDGSVTNLVAPTPADGYEPATVYEGIPYQLWPLDLYAPTGLYGIRATQGAAVATGTFDVGQPRAGLLRVKPPTSGSPGDEFVIQLAGVAPGAPVSVDVYLQRGLFTYLTTIESEVADQAGRAEHVLATSPSDAPGVYCLVIRGSPAAGCDTGEVVKLG